MLLQVDIEECKWIISVGKMNVPETKNIVKAHFKNYSKEKPIFTEVKEGKPTHEFQVGDEGFGELVFMK